MSTDQFVISTSARTRKKVTALEVIGFGVVVALWLGFAAALLFSQSSIHEAWEWFKGLSLIAQVPLGILFLLSVARSWTEQRRATIDLLVQRAVGEHAVVARTDFQQARDRARKIGVDRDQVLLAEKKVDAVLRHATGRCGIVARRRESDCLTRVPTNPHVFIDELLPLHRQATFPVARDRKLLGILLLDDLKKVPREQWRTRRAREVMRPVNSSMFVTSSATMASARELMQRNGVGAVAVKEPYQMEGMPGWIATLTGAGCRVVALDNRGHGESAKLYDPADYHTTKMAGDVSALGFMGLAYYVENQDKMKLVPVDDGNPANVKPAPDASVAVEIASLAKRMDKGSLDAVFVTDPEGRLLGLVTRADLQVASVHSGA